MKKLLMVLAVFGILWFPTVMFVSADAIQTTLFGNVAVDGYDSVAYFTQKKAVKGKKSFSLTYKDVNWHFSSLENLNAFKANPARFTPQYGGYCAWAISQGYKADGNPMNWTVHNDKLYLNYNDEIQNKWLKKVDLFISKADENWPL